MHRPSATGGRAALNPLGVSRAGAAALPRRTPILAAVLLGAVRFGAVRFASAAESALNTTQADELMDPVKTRGKDGEAVVVRGGAA